LVNDRLRAQLDTPGSCGLDVGAPPLDARLVPERRVPEREVLLAARRAVVVHHGHVAPIEPVASSPGLRIVALHST
jgi:hypothetical protein